MNAVTISDLGIDFKFNKRVSLYPDYEEYERRKRDLQKQDLSPELYQHCCREIADELGL